MNHKKIFTWKYLICLALSCTFLWSSTSYAQTNLALNKTATASISINPASNAVDGNPTTRWESNHGVNTAILQVDLGAVFNVTNTDIDWEAANAATYEVLGSTDNITWTFITAFNGGNFGNRTDSLTLSGNFRFLRINATSRSVGNHWGFSIWEWKIFGIAVTSSSSSTSNIINLATGAITSASTELGASANAIDGNGISRWESIHGIDPSWISVDLKAEKTLTSAVIHWEAANPAIYEVQGSHDNVNWTTLATRTDGVFGNRTDVTPLSGSFRHVRIFGTVRSVGNRWGYSIFELQIFGSSDSSSSISSSVASSPSNVIIDVDKSLLVHDTATLQAADFSFRSTLQQLVDQLNAINPGNQTTVEQLFSRMWDTQNPAPGRVAGGEKCTGVLNEFAVECRPAEGSQADNPVFFIGNYAPIALVNRLDLRDNIGFNDCGEYRVIFANQNGLRNFIIFEAQVPNPNPGVAAGCLPIAQFWQNLSTEDNPNLRAAALRDFYFDGIPAANVRPVIDIRNYAPATGQIRTNMFMGSSWNLKEFKVGVDNQGISMIRPVSVKSNPVAFLFDGTSTDARSPVFQADFIANMDSLLSDFNIFSLTVAKDAHNNGQSHASFPVDENQFTPAFFNANSNAFQQAVVDKLNTAGSNLTTTQVMNRATAMTCGGCHEPSSFGINFPNAIGPDQSWPNTLGFVHVSEFANAGVFPLSPALTDVFLPVRLAGFNDYLASTNVANQEATFAPASEPLSIKALSVPMRLSSTSSARAPVKKFNKRGG